MSPSTLSVTRAQAWLREQRFRLTKGREALVELLLQARSPLSLTELHRNLREQKVDFATVFRFMQLLEGAGLVIVHSWGDRQFRYELGARPGHAHHHHHLICRECERVEEVDVCALAQIERSLQAGTGFAEISHSLEFFGRCPACQRKNGRGRVKNRRRGT